MAGLLRFVAARPWPFVAILLAASVLAALQLPRLQIDVSPRSLSIEGDEARAFYQRTVDLFGSDNIAILFFKDPELFSREKLRAIRGAIGRLEALPYVERTESLFSVPYLRADDQGFVHTRPYLDTLPDSPAAVQAIRAAAAKNPFVHRNLLSEDGTVLAVNVYIDDRDHPYGFDQRVYEDLEQAIAPLRGDFERLFQIGLPSIRHAIDKHIREDQGAIVPLAVGVLLLTLALTLRRPLGALVPLLTAGLSVLWTLGLLAALDIPLNVMTALVPVLLVIIGSTEDIHLIAEYYKARGSGRTPSQAIRRMALNMGLAVLLTFSTTYLGFLSIAANPIQLLREFGVVASTALALNFLATVVLVPICMQYLGRRRPSAAGKRRQVFYEGMVKNIAGASLNHRRTVVLLTLAAVLTAAYGTLSLRVNNNLLDYFRDDDPVKRQAAMLHRDLAGIETVTAVVDGRIRGTFERVYYLQQLQKIQRHLDAVPEFDTSLSFADYVGLLNSVVNESGEPELPETDLELGELLLFAKREHVRGYVSEDHSRATIVIRHNVGDSETLARALAALEAFAAKTLDRGLELRITGESVLSNRAADYITLGQIRSLGLMMAVIFLIVALLFSNPRAGLMAVIPNAFPVVILFGVMGYAHIPLDTGTALIAAIAVGICVDNTMHFMVRYNRELRRHRLESAAIEATLRAEAMPITATSVSLAVGFATMALSGFTPVVYFGLLSGLVMLLAFYADFFITPILLSSTPLLTLWDLLSLKLRGELAGKCPLFAGMSARQIRRIVLLGGVREFHAGETIMRVGENGREMFVLLDGRAELFCPGRDGEPDRIHGLRRGSLFGVLAVVAEQKRLATAVAVEDTRLLALDWPRIQRLANAYPRATSLLYRNLARILGGRFAERVGQDLDRLPVQAGEISPQGCGQVVSLRPVQAGPES